MDLSMLMTELEAQTNVEENINNSMRKEVEVANTLSEKLKEEWSEAVKEAFPEKIVSLIKRFGSNGEEITKDNVTFFPTISIGDFHIGFKDKNFIVLKEYKAVGFYHQVIGDSSYRNYGYLIWNSYPLTFFNYLPSNIVPSTSKDLMTRIRGNIDLIYSYEAMLSEFKETLPLIYEEIAKLNAEYIKAKRGLITPEKKEEEKPKSYSITVVIEEV